MDIKNWRIDTGNTRSLSGKEIEIREAKIHILAITETKKKGKGQIELHLMLYSGVEKEMSAIGPNEGVAKNETEELWEQLHKEVYKKERHFNYNGRVK